MLTSTTHPVRTCQKELSHQTEHAKWFTGRECFWAVLKKYSPHFFFLRDRCYFSEHLFQWYLSYKKNYSSAPLNLYRRLFNSLKNENDGIAFSTSYRSKPAWLSFFLKYKRKSFNIHLGAFNTTAVHCDSLSFLIKHPRLSEKKTCVLIRFGEKKIFKQFQNHGGYHCSPARIQGFGTTWRWVNYWTILPFWWTVPLTLENYTLHLEA